jgi:hypothetical protein
MTMEPPIPLAVLLDCCPVEQQEQLAAEWQQAYNKWATWRGKLEADYAATLRKLEQPVAEPEYCERTLTPRQRFILDYCNCEGKTVWDIASALGRNHRTVRNELDVLKRANLVRHDITPNTTGNGGPMKIYFDNRKSV